MKRWIVKVMLALAVGVLCSGFALGIKYATGFTEGHLFGFVSTTIDGIILIAIPAGGLLVIWCVNRFLVKGPASKGITEVLDAAEQSAPLAPSKIYSHFLGGLATVSSGGSTGIEVSTVISSAAIGSWLGTSFSLDKQFKRYLLISGAAAGIAALFNSPLGGLFFAIEVLSGAFTLEMIGIVAIALTAAMIVAWNLDYSILFEAGSTGWNWYALPYFVAFSVVVAVLSAYMTRLVILMKSFFVRTFTGYRRALAGGLAVGISIFLFLPLYGEGYSVIRELLNGGLTLSNSIFGFGIGPYGYLIILILILLAKPMATSITLASGGDGGVFAPSLFLGAVAGFVFSHGCNVFFSAGLIESNFVVVGMAALLSASIHAPLTAIFLTTSITGSYVLMLPIVLTSYLSRALVKKILPYTVYTYGRAKVA